MGVHFSAPCFSSLRKLRLCPAQLVASDASFVLVLPEKTCASGSSENLAFRVEPISQHTVGTAVAFEYLVYYYVCQPIQATYRRGCDYPRYETLPRCTTESVSQRVYEFVKKRVFKFTTEFVVRMSSARGYVV